MSCENQVGVRNIIIRFHDCDTEATYGPLAHELSGTDQPTYRMCAYNNETLPGGYVRRTKSSAMMNLTVIRNPGIPLSMYQGCAACDVTIEHFNGLVVTGIAGTGTGETPSDAHEVQMEITFREIDELLPNGILDAAAT